MKLKPILHELHIYNKQNLRCVIEGILYRIRTGCPWRDIPSAFGNPNSIFKCFSRWSKKHTFLKIFKWLSLHADQEWLFIDGSYVKAHQHSSGGQGYEDQAIAKTAGGNTSKIHLMVDSHGNPIEFIVSSGTTHDVKVAPALIEKVDLTTTEALSADKGYDSDNLRQLITSLGTKANIPKKKNSQSNTLQMDWYLYKLRHLVENAFARLKHFRAIATRYDKLKCHYENSLALACAFLWLPL